MKYIYLVLSWIFGLLFFLFGMFFLFIAPLSTLPLFAISILLLPPIRKYAHSKLGIELPFKARVISICVFLILFGIFAWISDESKKQELAEQKVKESLLLKAQKKLQRIDYFHENRNKILLEVSNAIEKKNYEKALSIGDNYRIVNDLELSNLLEEAKTHLKELKNRETANNILEKLKNIPATDYEKNMNLYYKLAVIYPNNNIYQEKYSYYSKKVEKEKQKQKQKKERKQIIQQQFSAWDNSHRNLERFIKRSMNDPGSYKHVETVYWDKKDYLIVQTTFRGKNAFGAIVMNTVKAKVDMYGNIIKIIRQY